MSNAAWSNLGLLSIVAAGRERDGAGRISARGSDRARIGQNDRSARAAGTARGPQGRAAVPPLLPADALPASIFKRNWSGRIPASDPL
jgi:hypothetical protein